jgi:hypothetical protein
VQHHGSAFTILNIHPAPQYVALAGPSTSASLR